jgi:hypothetical protein
LAVAVGLAGLGGVGYVAYRFFACTPDHPCGPSLDLDDGPVEGLVVVGENDYSVVTVVLNEDGIIVVSTAASVVGPVGARSPVAGPNGRPSGWAQVIAWDDELGLIALRLEDPSAWDAGVVAESAPSEGDQIRALEIWVGMLNTTYGVGDWPATVTATGASRDVWIGQVMGANGPEQRYATMSNVSLLTTTGFAQPGSAVLNADGAIAGVALDSMTFRPIDQVMAFVARVS